MTEASSEGAPAPASPPPPLLSPKEEAQEGAATAVSAGDPPAWDERECVVAFAAGELDLRRTLQPGQCFTWDEVRPGVFEGVLHGCLLRFWTTPADPAPATPTPAPTAAVPAVDLHCRCTHPRAPPPPDADAWPAAPDPAADLAAFVRWYLRADTPLAALHAAWARSPHPLARALCGSSPSSSSSTGSGVRLLRQEPVECLVSFICSQNNRVPRIHALVAALRTHLGAPLALPPGCCSASAHPAHAFPSLARLAAADTPAVLARLRLGYRAPYVPAAAAAVLARGGAAWLHALAAPAVAPAAACAALETLRGVGPKVAACTALYALDKRALVPLDVHMLAVAARALPRRATAAGSDRARRERVQAAFVDAFGDCAGWAQAVLFTRELEGTTTTSPQPKEEEQQPQLQQPRTKRARRSP